MAKTSKIGGLYVTDDYIDVTFGEADVLQKGAPAGLFSLKILDSERFWFRNQKPNKFGAKRIEATFDLATSWMFENTGGIEKLGIGCYGPFKTLDWSIPTSERIDQGYGYIDSTIHPKLAQRNLFLIVKESFERIQESVPEIRIQTDANVAALGELYHRHVLNGQWIDDGKNQVISFLKFSRGVGGGVVYGDKLWGGRLHPEMGQIRVERWKSKIATETKAEELFPGVCEYHGGCLEGLSSAGAFTKRWNKEYWAIKDNNHEAWDRQAHYVAQLCVNVTCLFAPSRIVLGGSLVAEGDVINKVREKFSALMGKNPKNYYPSYPDLFKDDYIDGFTIPEDGIGSGVRGATVLAATLFPKLDVVSEFQSR